MLDKTLGYILCCQSPGLFVLALLLLVEFLGSRRHKVRAFFRLLGCSDESVCPVLPMRRQRHCQAKVLGRLKTN